MDKVCPTEPDLGCFNPDRRQAGRPGLRINATAKISVNYLTSRDLCVQGSYKQALRLRNHRKGGTIRINRFWSEIQLPSKQF